MTLKTLINLASYDNLKENPYKEITKKYMFFTNKLDIENLYKILNDLVW